MSSMRKKLAMFKWQILAAASLVAIVLQSPALASAALKKAMGAYKNKDYKAAINLLNKAATENPYNAELHYYLANCYIFQQDGNAAIKEYSTCFDLEPLSTFGQYSRQALLAFGNKFHGFSAQPFDGKKHVAPDDAKSIKQAVELIRKQTCEQETLNHAQGETAAKAAVDGGEIQNTKINKAAAQLIEDLTPRYRGASPALQEELHEIRQRAVFAGQHARQDAAQQASKHMAHAAKLSTSIETSASSLLSLISESPKPGHVKVKAAGTNLYVRNYDMEPALPIEPLHAEWELLPSAHAATSLKVPPVRKSVNPQIKQHSNNTSPHVVLTPQKQQSHNLKTAAPTRERDRATVYKDHLDSAFIPGSSKVLVTDLDGRILLHVRDNNPKRTVSEHD